MYREQCEELIQLEVEQISESFFGAHYFELSPELRCWVRACAIEMLRPDALESGFIAAA
jgi:hypothetical protein